MATSITMVTIITRSTTSTISTIFTIITITITGTPSLNPKLIESDYCGEGGLSGLQPLGL